MHKNCKLIFEKYGRQYFRSRMKVLDIGPDHFPSTHQMSVGDRSIEWHTLDIRTDSSLTYCSQSQYEFPVGSETYDVVLSGSVIEHVRQVWVWIRELARVCKIGGFVITINPVSWPYHEAPVDCWRIYPEGMKALYEHASLEVKLSEWESLEASRTTRTIPGCSAEFRSTQLRLAYRLLGIVGFPVECAFDTITVGQKNHNFGVNIGSSPVGRNAV